MTTTTLDRKQKEAVFITIAIDYGIEEKTARQYAKIINNLQTFLEVISTKENN